MAEEPEVYEEEMVEGAPEEVEYVDVEAILQEYHKRQLMEHMAGPLVSLFVHVVVLTLMATMVEGSQTKIIPPVEVTIEEVEVKELDEPLIEEIEELPEDIVEEAPIVDAPPAPTEEVTEVATESIGDEAPDVADSFGDMDLAESDVVQSYSPLKLAGLYSSRGAQARQRSVRKHGGSRASQNAVLKALDWLQSVQKTDGSWDGGSAHTGLALLCFLAHGETPLSDKYGLTVQKAMQWLANDIMRAKLSGGRAYSHGIATYAISEAYGMTQIPFLRSAMEKGLDVIIRGQQPGGGYDYRYKKGDRWDTSVVGWQVQALKAGKAAGATNPGLDRAMDKSSEFLRKTSYKNGRFGYSSPGAGSGNMTGVGTVCLQLLGEGRSLEARGGLEYIATKRLEAYKSFLGGKDYNMEGGKYLYGFYYDTQAMFNQGGSNWKAWNRVFQNVLVRAQHREGYWEFTGKGGHFGGGTGAKILITTWSCLQLEVYYRYLPTFDIEKMESVERTSLGSILEEDTGLIIE